MKKLLGAAVLVLAMSGCGGPLQDDGTDVTGATRQEISKTDAPRSPNQAPELNPELWRSAQEQLVRMPAFQEQQHLTDPIRHPGCP